MEVNLKRNKKFLGGNPALFLPLARWTHIRSTISSIIEMFGGIWAMPSRETQTLINLNYSPLFPPLCLLLTPLCLPLSRTNVSLSLSSSIHTVKDHFLQGIWFFNEDSNNDYGYFKTVCLPCALMEAEAAVCACKGPVRWCWNSNNYDHWLLIPRTVWDDKCCAKDTTGIT